MIIFGPIPSRRLGRSLGINNIPPKICSYSCIYCQLGNTNSMTVNRKEFFPPSKIYEEVSEKLETLNKSGEKLDYLTFVPDGEPTLDLNLGKTIKLLKPLGIKIAVITNSSLLWNKYVQNDLMNADWVSVKIDSAYEDIWRNINRPHGSLDFKNIINGIEEFTSCYNGSLVTETMLVRRVNDSIESLTKTAEMISRIKPKKSYILIPTRPPAEKNVNPPTEESLNMAYQIYNFLLNNVELVVYNEGTNFSFSSDAEKELLSILAVHPMRKDAIEEFLIKSNSTWDLINKLIANNKLKTVEYARNDFLLKTLGGELWQ